MSLTQRQSIVQELHSLPVGRTVVEFLDHLTVEAGLSHNTILAYGRDIRDFLGFCREDGVDEIGGVTPHLVQVYLGELARRDKSESSAKRALVAIRMFLRFAKLRGLIEDAGEENALRRHCERSLLTRARAADKLAASICEIQIKEDTHEIPHRACCCNLYGSVARPGFTCRDQGGCRSSTQ